MKPDEQKMTVEQLIKMLKKFPPEMDVFLESADEPRHAIEIRSAALDLVHHMSRRLWSDVNREGDEPEFDNAVVIYWSWHPDDE